MEKGWPSRSIRLVRQVFNGPHDVAGGNILGRWQRKFSKDSDVQIQGYFDRTTRHSPQLDEIRNTFDIDLLYHLTLKGGQNVLMGVGGRWSPDASFRNSPRSTSSRTMKQTAFIADFFRTRSLLSKQSGSDLGFEVRAQ